MNAGGGLSIADDGALKVNAGEGLTIDTENGNVLKVNKGTIAENNTGFVTGGEVHGALALKANTDLDNISDTGKAAVRGLAKESVKVVDGTRSMSLQSAPAILRMMLSLAQQILPLPLAV